MKRLMKLAVLLTAVLLLHGAALAFPPCDYEECYEVTTTLIDNPDTVIPPFFAKICLVYGDNIGKASRCGEDDVYMSLFFDSMNKQALVYGEDCVQYFKFHGDNNHISIGTGYCEEERFSSRAIKTEMANCNCST
jgi:hypothetical protein